MANIAKRSHEDSSDSEKDIKKRRYEESSDEDEEHDEEEEVEINAVRNAGNVTGPGKWNVEDSHRLLISIMSLLPQCDVQLYSEQEAQIDWGKVSFGSFSADQCREHWHKLTKKVRLYRTMGDLVVDALSLLPRPSSSFQMIQKNNRMMNLKHNPMKLKSSLPKISHKVKSSLPKICPNVFSLFMQEKIKTLPHIPAVERLKHISQLYKDLSEAEKNELNERFDETKRNHVKILKKMKEDNPSLAEEIDAHIKKLEKIPGEPKKPKSSVINKNNSLLKYMSKKTTPAQIVGDSSNASSGRSPKKSSPMKSSIPSKSKAMDDESDQSSDDFGKKSKPQSAKAAEEEDSSTSDSSDNKKESNASSGRSPKKSSPVKSTLTPFKSKAIDDESDQSSDDFGKKSKPQSAKAAEEEDSSTSDSSDNMEERNGRSPKKSAPVKKFKAKVEKPSVSDHSGSEDEEEKRPMPPKKGHSAIPAVVPETKLNKPFESKKKKKKKDDVVTGFSQFMTTKMAGYRQKFPELNDREIAMKLAGKWERLSDKKKNKYEKLALKKMPSEEVD